MSDRRLSSFDQTLKKLLDNAAKDNLADDIEEEERGLIGRRVRRGFEIDDESRTEWKDKAHKAMEAALQVRKSKSFPFDRASNVKYPLLTTAAIQFGSRAYPAIVDGTDIVKGQVLGKDEDGSKRAKADRVSAHMSWQLLNQMKGWEEDTDILLHHLPIIGDCFRKVWRSAEENRNRVQMVSAMEIIVNQSVKSLETAPRITHRYFLYPDQIAEKQAAGIWLDVSIPKSNTDEDADAPEWFLEQHRREDLDDDGYPEPIIVTIHQESGTVVRIVANYCAYTKLDGTPSFKGITVKQTKEGKPSKIIRIEPKQYFVHYPFLPDPAGGFYGIGFGHLLDSITSTIDTSINQMMDAATLQNAGGGFIGSGLRLGDNAGTVRFRPGEYKVVQWQGKVGDAIYNMEHPGPSDVSMKLLDMMIGAAKDVTGIKDILTGESAQNMQPTTALALIEQGLKEFTAIYKRIYRSLTQEFKLLFDLNAEYMDPQEYFSFAGEEMQIASADYDADAIDICPVADPRAVTDMQKLTRAEILLQFKDDPMFKPLQVRQRYLSAAGIDNLNEILLTEQEADAQKQQMQEMQMQGHAAEVDKTKADTIHKRAGTVHLLAKAEMDVAKTPHPIQALMESVTPAIEGQQPQQQSGQGPHGTGPQPGGPGPQQANRSMALPQ